MSTQNFRTGKIRGVRGHKKVYSEKISLEKSMEACYFVIIVILKRIFKEKSNVNIFFC